MTTITGNHEIFLEAAESIYEVNWSEDIYHLSLSGKEYISAAFINSADRIWNGVTWVSFIFFRNYWLMVFFSVKQVQFININVKKWWGQDAKTRARSQPIEAQDW